MKKNFKWGVIIANLIAICALVFNILWNIIQDADIVQTNYDLKSLEYRPILTLKKHVKISKEILLTISRESPLLNRIKDIKNISFSDTISSDRLDNIVKNIIDSLKINRNTIQESEKENNNVSVDTVRDGTLRKVKLNIRTTLENIGNSLSKLVVYSYHTDTSTTSLSREVVEVSV